MALTVLLCAVAACNGRSLPTAPASSAARVADVCNGQTPPPASGANSTARPRSARKTPIHGLIDLGQVIADDMPEPPPNTLYYVCRRQGAISGIVVNDTWEHMQRNGGQTIDTSSVDRALKAIAAYNAKPGRSLGVRLRIWAGIDAPDWAKRIGGAPIRICDGDAVRVTPRVQPAPAPTPCPSVAIRTVGRFWSNGYERAWRNFESLLAKAYDRDARVNEVSLSSCSSLTSEPFVAPEDTYSRANLITAGYTDAKYRNCLLHAVELDYAPFWSRTPVDFSFNPFREIDKTPPATDLAFTETAVDECRTVAGSRCILLNETMAKFTPPPSPSPSQSPSIAQSYYAMWSYMKHKGGSITFQTASPPNLLAAWGRNRAGWNAAVSLGASFGASSLELFPPKGVPCRDKPARQWISGYSCFGKRVLAGWKNELH